MWLGADAWSGDACSEDGLGDSGSHLDEMLLGYADKRSFVEWDGGSVAELNDVHGGGFGLATLVGWRFEPLEDSFFAETRRFRFAEQK